MKTAPRVSLPIVLYALVAYLAFFATFTALFGFVEGFPAAHALDAPARTGVGPALAVDLGWFVLFALQHSAMARPSFKRRWTRIVPVAAERSTYVLASSLMLLLLFAMWQPIPLGVWQVPTRLACLAVTGLSFAGWGLAMAATYAIDHFELFGLRQAFGAPRAKDTLPSLEGDAPVLRTPALYRIVRHPLYLGFLIAFWATPVMTVGHLVFALGMTGYILVGVHFEERDLVRTFGAAYVRYRQRVPALLPWPRPSTRAPGAAPIA